MKNKSQQDFMASLSCVFLDLVYFVILAERRELTNPVGRATVSWLEIILRAYVPTNCTFTFDTLLGKSMDDEIESVD